MRHGLWSHLKDANAEVRRLQERVATEQGHSANE